MSQRLARTAHTSTTAHGIDLTAPGGIDQLLAFHRNVFGDARMEAGDGAPAGDGTGTDGQPAGGPPADAGTPPVPTPPAGQQPPASAWDGKVESLPADAQKMIRDLRKEAGDRRTQLTAAEQRQQDVVRALAKAAGIELPGDDAQAPDPAQLTQQLTAAQQAQRQTAVELAVYRAAGTHQGDPNALLDSRAFLAKVADLDPAADDFAAKVDTAIKDAVSTNPKLKAAGRVPGASSVDAPGGQGGAPRTPIPLDQAVNRHYSG